MKTAVVNFKTTPEIKKRASERAMKAGIPLSFLLNHRLNEIASGERLTVGFEAEEPSEWLKNELKTAEKESREGWVSPSFDNAEDAIAWLKDPNAKYERDL